MNTTEFSMNSAISSMISTVVEDTKKVGTRFAGITYTTKEGKTSRYNLLLGIKLESLYKSDLRYLTTLRSNLDGVKAVACDELINSITESLNVGIGNNSGYTLKGYYEPITSNGEVKLHKDEETGETFLYIRGYVVKETVMVPGVYKTVKSSEKTLAKKEIEKNMKRGKLRTFKINVNNLQSIRVNGMRLEIN